MKHEERIEDYVCLRYKQREEEEVFEEVKTLRTEMHNPRTKDLDKLSTAGVLELINAEDHLVAPAVKAALPEITKATEDMMASLRAGGRIVHVGAGASGRVAVADSTEMTSTFSVPISGTGLSLSSGLTITGGSILATNIGATFGSTTAVSPLFSSGAVISSGDLLISTGKIVSGGAGTSTFTGGISSAGLSSSAGLNISSGDALFSGLIKGLNTGTSTFTGGISTAGLSTSAGIVSSAGDLLLSGGKIVSTGTGTSTFSGSMDISNHLRAGSLEVLGATKFAGALNVTSSA
ncbi:MAG: hypothetical protein ABIN58_08480, partial [candidate division WOR-3 bacterium]